MTRSNKAHRRLTPWLMLTGAVLPLAAAPLAQAQEVETPKRRASFWTLSS